MQRLPRGCWAYGLVAVVVLTVPAARAAAQAPSAAAEKVRFETFDRVELQGLFYPGSKGNKSPCVLLLHAIGSTSHQEGWDDLAKELQQKGFAVLSFDFRGLAAAKDLARSDGSGRGHEVERPLACLAAGQSSVARILEPALARSSDAARRRTSRW